MPYVNIKITRETPVTAEQKAALIRGVTDLLHQTIGRGPATTGAPGGRGRRAAGDRRAWSR